VKPMPLKRFLDIVLSSLALLLSSPILVAVSLAVWLASGRPVLFRQRRVGLRFRRFDILKFRTMRAAAGLSVTVAGDDRVTRIGRFLRHTKLDELPQFWNVLRGDMSLVGPRPEIPQYVEMFEERYRAILTFRPGSRTWRPSVSAMKRRFLRRAPNRSRSTPAASFQPNWISRKSMWVHTRS